MYNREMEIESKPGTISTTPEQERSLEAMLRDPEYLDRVERYEKVRNWEMGLRDGEYEAIRSKISLWRSNMVGTKFKPSEPLCITAKKTLFFHKIIGSSPADTMTITSITNPEVDELLVLLETTKEKVEMILKDQSLNSVQKLETVQKILI